jgi:exopolysaccharide biosynthesis protein
MKEFFLKPYRWAAVFSLLLIAFFAFVLLDTFVIPKSFITIKSEPSAQTQRSFRSQSEAVITGTSYKDENMNITIEETFKYNSTVYIAYIQLSSASYLKTALADSTYGRNITEKTSEIAKANNAIFAVNGDYYGARNEGYVLRNGLFYRNSARKAGDCEALVINKEGDFSIIQESQMSTKSLNTSTIWQILSFGPALVRNGQVTIDRTSDIALSKNRNPRTAIGQISKLNYVIIVADGRTEGNLGLSLLELAQEFTERGCTVAYNLDGGGSSTMYFNGEIVNNPNDGRKAGEREISDIVYIGYK